MTEPQWHCYYDRTQDGPFPESALVRRFGERLVPLHALVWSETWRDDPEWRPAREIDAFRRAAAGPVLKPSAAAPVRPMVVAAIARSPLPSRARPANPLPPRPAAAPSFLPPGVALKPQPRRGIAPPPPPPTTARPPRAAVPSGVILPPPGPWERFWARMIDLVVGGNALLALLILPFVPDLPDGGVFFVQGVVAPLCWMVLEPLLIHTFGTTPGKWVFDIQIQTPGGNLPGFWQAVRRCASVFFVGVGMGLLPFALLGMGVAYNQLLTEGQTSWDKAAGLTVVSRGSGWLGWTVLTSGCCAAVWGFIHTWHP